MNGRYPVLEAREARYLKKQALARAEGPVLAATLRVPYALRHDPQCRAWHRAACARLERSFDVANIPLKPVESLIDADGPCALYLVAEADAAKRLCMALEACDPLMDFDVMNELGENCSREDYGLPPRPCFVCGGVARACIALRAHDAASVEQAVRLFLAQSASH